MYLRSSAYVVFLHFRHHMRILYETKLIEHDVSR